MQDESMQTIENYHVYQTKIQMGFSAWAVCAIMVGISYPLMYQPCPFTQSDSVFWYLAAIIIIFQFGWAAAQISHLLRVHLICAPHISFCELGLSVALSQTQTQLGLFAAIFES